MLSLREGRQEDEVADSGMLENPELVQSFGSALEATLPGAPCEQAASSRSSSTDSEGGNDGEVQVQTHLELLLVKFETFRMVLEAERATLNDVGHAAREAETLKKLHQCARVLRQELTSVAAFSQDNGRKSEEVRAVIPIRQPIGMELEPPVLIPCVTAIVRGRRIDQVLTFLWVAGFLASQLSWTGVGPPQVTGVIACCMLPKSFAQVAWLNRTILRELLQEFEILYVVCLVIGLVASGCFLARENPWMTIAYLCGAPSFFLACFMDAFPLRVRIKSAKEFFIANVLALCVLSVSLVMGVSKTTEYSLELQRFRWSTTGFFLSCASSLLAFGMRNLSMAVLEPESLVVLRSRVVDVVVSNDVFQSICEAHAQLVFGVGNATLKEQRARPSLSGHILASLPEFAVGARRYRPAMSERPGGS